MSGVFEIVKTICLTTARTVLHRRCPIGMARSTLSKLLARLMSMTAITLSMSREAGFDSAAAEAMATGACKFFTSSRHLLRIHVISM
jgi:hypothetical protein